MCLRTPNCELGHWSPPRGGRQPLSDAAYLCMCVCMFVYAFTHLCMYGIEICVNVSTCLCTCKSHLTQTCYLLNPTTCASYTQNTQVHTHTHTQQHKKGGNRHFSGQQLSGAHILTSACGRLKGLACGQLPKEHWVGWGFFRSVCACVCACVCVFVCAID